MLAAASSFSAAVTEIRTIVKKTCATSAKMHMKHNISAFISQVFAEIAAEIATWLVLL